MGWGIKQSDIAVFGVLPMFHVFGPTILYVFTVSEG